MKMRKVCTVLALLPVCVTIAAAAETNTVNWPQFRGVQASGVAAGRTPETWTKPKWKTEIGGLAHSCPVIWGDRIFLTTAVSGKGDQELKIGLYGSIESVEESGQYLWQVLCIDKRDGKVLWTKFAQQGIPKMKRHPKSSHANCTPATDGTNVVCFFGAEGLYCYDFEGNLLWRKDFGTLDSGYYSVPTAQWGFASSPVIHENMVIVQCDVQTNSFIAALDIKDGREIWRTPRTDVPTWSTPTVDVRSNRAQVIVNGYRHIGGYDLRTGKELWKMGEGGDIPVPTPIIAQDLIFITSAHGRLSPIYAIRPNATNDISLRSNEKTNEFVAWSVLRGGNYMQTPVALGDYLYCCRDHGVLTCFTAKTGEQHYSERLGTGRAGFTASMVAADNKVYATSEEGKVYVIKAGPRFDVLAMNDLGEPCMATPAISEGALYFRTKRHLICIADEGKATQ
ncbi:MAG TPA: PQQ-binding-like beta-propeller repeat protein [Candidatus Binatia bacterium]|nr:PQQ-binding-like beta-propeller repeat protein [Candidatus Binatia bacterium]